MTYILTTFPLVKQPVKDAALAAFRTFQPKPGDPEIAALLAAGESARVEFKSTARWDLRENKKSPVLEQVILKTVAAFLNSQGGTVLLGVADDGTALGLDADFAILHKKNADGYELFLTDLLLGHFGKDCSPCVRITSPARRQTSLPRHRPTRPASRLGKGRCWRTSIHPQRQLHPPPLDPRSARILQDALVLCVNVTISQ